MGCLYFRHERMTAAIDGKMVLHLAKSVEITKTQINQPRFKYNLAKLKVNVSHRKGQQFMLNMLLVS
ncbi:hypothetical protein Nepgr_005658 [Nepenthes gracilis]|uniref:Uncharacterized protein n=1 Tax=Nepenthes gracilis TaxID=150966 RepID=A0AAD3S3Z8_NEPGR|nr:hypothetical protein Nepgr_005658 [Nepenthes gracilis]